MNGSSVVARCETMEMFETIEASLDAIVAFVKNAFVRDEHLAVPFCEIVRCPLVASVKGKAI